MASRKPGERARREPYKAKRFEKGFPAGQPERLLDGFYFLSEEKNTLLKIGVV
jgi:hypothetical protein